MSRGNNYAAYGTTATLVLALVFAIIAAIVYGASDKIAHGCPESRFIPCGYSTYLPSYSTAPSDPIRCADLTGLDNPFAADRNRCLATDINQCHNDLRMFGTGIQGIVIIAILAAIGLQGFFVTNRVRRGRVHSPHKTWIVALVVFIAVCGAVQFNWLNAGDTEDHVTARRCGNDRVQTITALIAVQWLFLAISAVLAYIADEYTSTVDRALEVKPSDNAARLETTSTSRRSGRSAGANRGRASRGYDSVYPQQDEEPYYENQAGLGPNTNASGFNRGY